MKTNIFGTLARVVGVALITLSLALTACGNGTNEPPALTGTVTIDNTSPKVGDTLTASYAGGNGSGTAAWQWLANDAAITGANTSTYVVVSGDLGKTLKARVSYSNQSGSVTSNPTAAVIATETENENENDPEKLTLSGSITIIAGGSPVTTSTTNITLTAVYSGNEAVTFEWYKDGSVINNKNGWFINRASSPIYTPYEPKVFTVLVSAEGYNSKLSDAVTVTGSVIPPEQYTIAADRWSKWTDAASTTTLVYSVDSDDKCTITVGGTADPEWEMWKTNAQYTYTTAVNAAYEYTFEAWTESDERNVYVLYYYDEGVEYFGRSITITSTPTSYTIKGVNIPKGGVEQVEFQCANQTGTFYVKNLTITPYTPALEYELISSGPNADTYRVIYSPLDGEVTIPATYNSKAVTEIGAEAFYENTRITSVSIPTSVTDIGDRAFYRCTSLGSVSFVDGSQLKTIGHSAFMSCYNLETITIPASVTSIGDNAFRYCTSLASITIPASVTLICNQAFSGCTGLTSVIFEAGSSIPTGGNFGTNVFPEGNDGWGGDTLRTAYFAPGGGAGTYWRAANGNTWMKGEWPVLTITNNSGRNTAVKITSATITGSTDFETLTADGAVGQGSIPKLYLPEQNWSNPFTATGTYNVMLRLVKEYNDGLETVKYQNNVSFVNGSGTVDWDTMTEIP